MSSSQTPRDYPKRSIKAFVKNATQEFDKHLHWLHQWQAQISDIQPLMSMRHSLAVIHHSANDLKCIILANILEKMIYIIDKVHVNELRPTNQVYQFLLFALDECSNMLIKLEANQACMAVDELEASFKSLTQEVESPETIEPIIPIEIFHEELLEIIEELESYKRLAKAQDPEALSGLKRVLHTLKGSARLVGFKYLGDFIHQVEDKVEDSTSEQNQVLISDLIQWLNQNQGNILEKINVKPNFDALKRLNAATSDKASSPRFVNIESQDKLRLPLSQIERFSHLAATANITRAHIQQQQAALSDSMQLFYQVIGKLNEKTRALQVQADAALGLSTQVDVLSQDFDSLEMDRYTQLQHHVRDIHDLHASLFGLHDDMSQTIQDIELGLREQYHAAHALEEGLTHVRMIPFESIVPRLESMVAQISSELNKEVRFEVTKAQGELDRSVLDKLISPLEHMLRNAIDHGIEPKKVRLALGKQPFGTLKISMQRKGAHVNMTLSDDGGGIDLDLVRTRAKEEKWWQEDREPSQRDLIKMIFQPGFSTSSQTTMVSGRGVGMDIVFAQIRKLGGSIKVHTQKDQGAQFTIQLPFTSSLNKALVFSHLSQTYGLLTSNITAITRMAISDLRAIYTNEKILTYMGKRFPLYDCGELLGKTSFLKRKFQKKALPVILIESQDVMFALIIDKVMGPREVLLKSLGPQMQSISQLLGGGVLGDGSIILMLDPLGIIEYDVSMSSYKPSSTISTTDDLEKKIMVIDDSMTVRKVTTTLLERHRYRVITAKDGLHALEQLKTFTPDCILVDLEMPRMDGYSFLEARAQDEALNRIPVIVISSRSLEKYKKRAYQMGADCFISKPFQEDTLLKLIDKTLRPLDG